MGKYTEYIKTGIIAFLATLWLMTAFKAYNLEKDVAAALSAEASAKMELVSVRAESLESRLGLLQTISEKNDWIEKQQHDIIMLNKEIEASQ